MLTKRNPERIFTFTKKKKKGKKQKWHCLFCSSYYRSSTHPSSRSGTSNLFYASISKMVLEKFKRADNGVMFKMKLDVIRCFDHGEGSKDIVYMLNWGPGQLNVSPYK